MKFTFYERDEDLVILMSSMISILKKVEQGSEYKVVEKSS